MVSTFFALGAVVVIAVVVLLAGIGSMSRRWEPAASLWDRARDEIGPHALTLAWAMAFLATAGSLYYSEIAHYPPCELCWYQRIGMYPLVVMLAIAALGRDGGVIRYALPVVGGGGLIAVYHVLIQGLPDLDGGTCSLGVPCTVRWVDRFGVSIPVMALAAFAMIATLILIDRADRLARGAQEIMAQPADEP